MSADIKFDISQLKQMTADTGEGDKKSVFKAWERDSRFFNPFAEREPLQVWCNIGARKALPKKGLITFSAKWKQGKSLASYALTIPLLSGKQFSNIYPVDKPQSIIFFDAEMNGDEIAERAKPLTEALGNDANFGIISLVELGCNSPEERLNKILEVLEEYQPDIAVIDQVATLVHDINSISEATELINKLQPYYSTCSLWCVIHENKNNEDTNMRGHLGTMLAHGASEAYSVRKKNDGIFEVEAKFARRSNVDGAAKVVFGLDDNGNIIDATFLNAEKEDEQRRIKASEWYKDFSSIFGEDTELQSCEIVKRLRERQNLEERRAKDKIRIACKEWGILVKTSDEHRAPYKIVIPTNSALHHL